MYYEPNLEVSHAIYNVKFIQYVFAALCLKPEKEMRKAKVRNTAFTCS